MCFSKCLTNKTFSSKMATSAAIPSTFVVSALPKDTWTCEGKEDQTITVRNNKNTLKHLNPRCTNAFTFKIGHILKYRSIST